MVQKRRPALSVTAGSARGTRLSLPPEVRPMASRMKQALFNILADRLPGAAVLDLFAGTGSLGIEAVSRGARSATLVEKNRKYCGTIKANLKKARAEEKCLVLSADAYRVGGTLPRGTGPFSIIFLDPPYAQSEDKASRRRLLRMLAGLGRDGIIDPAAVIVLHVRAGAVTLEDVAPELEAVDSRCYGSGALIICRLKKTFAATWGPVVQLPGVEEED